MARKKRLTNQELYVLYGSILRSQLLVESAIDNTVKGSEKFKDRTIVDLETALKNLKHIESELAGRINFSSLTATEVL